MPYSDRRSKVLGCSLLLVFTLAGIGLLLVLSFPGPYMTAPPRPFDAAIWKKADSWDDTRCAMIADLRFRIGLKGKTRAEVAALLGPSDDETASVGASHWHLCPSFMDIWILEVRWQNDRVTEFWLRDT
jgi:hypothetical protein